VFIGCWICQVWYTRSCQRRNGGSRRYAELLDYQDARSGLITYCYEILIGERLVRQMKKYKEAMEEKFVYSADSFVLAYLFTDSQTDCLNTENFSTRWFLQRRSPFLTRTAFRPIHRHAPRAFPVISANPPTSIQTRYTRPSSMIDND